MLKIPFITWIANAAVGLTGLYGDVTHQAEVADCSRQTIYDHAHKVQAAVEDAHDGGPTRARLIAENQQLRHENAQLLDWLARTIEFPPDKQREFTVTAAAMGLSLNQVLALLALILGKHAGPGRSTLHRWIKRAAVAAGRVLKVLDAQCRALVLVGCLDEIFFHGRPVLVGVEPARPSGRRSLRRPPGLVLRSTSAGRLSRSGTTSAGGGDPPSNRPATVDPSRDRNGCGKAECAPPPKGARG